MNYSQKIPIHDIETERFLGYIAQDGTGWVALTVFGYNIARAHDQKTVEAMLREQGAAYLSGVWQYYDRDDSDWHYCAITKASEHQVTVKRTTVMGYQDQDDFKIIIIDDPSETTLVKS